MIKERHPEIDIFEIDFPSLKGAKFFHPNDDKSVGDQVRVADQTMTMDDLFTEGDGANEEDATLPSNPPTNVSSPFSLNVTNFAPIWMM